MSTRLTTILCLALILAIVGAAVRAQGSEAHPSAYCGKGLNVTGNYAVAFKRQYWRQLSGNQAELVRVYKHYQRIGDTSQFRYVHQSKRVCGGIG